MRAWLGFAFLALTACGSEPSAVAVGQTFELGVAKSQTVDSGLRVTLNSVTSDSRCPTDVTCVWAGDATLQLTVSAPGVPARNGELHAAKLDESLSIGGFEIHLRELRPAPLSTRPIAPADYVAVLVATEAK